MKRVVFYSWQSDLANGTNRSLIEAVLRDVAVEIGNDESVDIEPVIDRDTQGVAGAPDIAATIFGKIDAADIFVADISIVVKSKKRQTPNPNVIIELGYALKALGHERIVLVFNESSGKKEKLPFDLKTRRILTYNCPEHLTDRSEVKKGLAKDLKAALLTGFSHVSSKRIPNTPSIIEIIKSGAPSRKIDLRSHLDSVLVELDKIQPKMVRDGGTADDLLKAIPQTENLVTDFAKMAETIVVMKDFELAQEVFKWFGNILTRYHPVQHNGPTSNADGDFFKFIGHELFVAFVNPFLKEGHLKELGDLLKEPLKVGANAHKLHETKESWIGLSRHSPLLMDESKKRGRMSYHADLLKLRHEKGELSKIVPFRDFIDADFFLYLHGEGKSAEEYYAKWYPTSIVMLDQMPSYIMDAVAYPKAMKLCHALGISDIEELKMRLRSGRKLADWGYKISDRDIDAIGTTGGGSIVRLDRE